MPPGGSLTVNKNITLYAVWKSCSHSYTGGICDTCKYEYPISVADYKYEFVVVNADGAKIWSRPYSNKSTHVRTEKKGAVLNIVGITLNEEGHTWLKLSDGNWVYTENVSRRYAVKYNANGGKNPPATQYFLSGQTLTLSKTKPTRVGYTFQGWATNSSSTTVDYAPGATYSKNANVTLYAVWKACKTHDYTGGICSKCKYEYPLSPSTYSAKMIVTNADGASIWARPYSKNTTKVRVDAKGKVLTVKAKVVNQEGNTWYQLSDGNWVFSGNVKRGYTLKFDANGGEAPPSSIVAVKNAKVTIPSTKPTRSGYTFLGWSSSKTGSVELKPGATYVVLGDATVYAVWAKNVTITSNPASKNLLVDKSTTFTVKASGTGLKYQWQYRTSSSGSWTNSTLTSATSATLSVTALASRDGYQYRCKVTDKYGNTATSGIATLRVLSITTQPKTTYTKQGATMNVTVKATGKGLTYQWYFKNAGTDSYSKSSIQDATYATTMNSTSKDRRIYCVITDASGNKIQTETVILRMAATITKQPATTCVKKGNTASVTVNAVGDGLTYKWYYKNAGDSAFTLTNSFTSNKYAVEMNATRHGRQVYCVVTDKYGNQVKSSTATLSMAATITKQPVTTYAKKGTTASVTVKAIGSGLTYQWYCTSNGSTSEFLKSSITSATYSTTMDSSRNGRKVYCVITDKYGNQVKSSTATLRMAATITQQPKSVTVAKGATAKVTFKAEGDGLTYTWYFKDPGSSKFSKTTTFTGNTYTIPSMTASRSGRQIYCVVKDKYGNTVQTNTVTIQMK